MPSNLTPKLTWITLDELTDLLHISERHVRRLVAENRIPYTKVGGRLRFNLVRIQDWLDQNNHEPDRSFWRGKPASTPIPARPKSRRRTSCLISRRAKSVPNRDGNP
jgi:excisionase family DNA binding protein